MGAIEVIQGLLSLMGPALNAYAEIRGTLDADTQAEVDALIAQIRSAALVAEAQAETDLRNAALGSA